MSKKSSDFFPTESRFPASRSVFYKKCMLKMEMIYSNFSTAFSKAQNSLLWRMSATASATRIEGREGFFQVG